MALKFYFELSLTQSLGPHQNIHVSTGLSFQRLPSNLLWMGFFSLRIEVFHSLAEDFQISHYSIYCFRVFKQIFTSHTGLCSILSSRLLLRCLLEKDVGRVQA